VVFVTLVLSSQATIYLVRTGRRAWADPPSPWLLAATAADVLAAAALALSGALMHPLPPGVLATVAVAVVLGALVADARSRSPSSGGSGYTPGQGRAEAARHPDEPGEGSSPMGEYRIVVGLDGSPASRKALEWTLEEARLPPGNSFRGWSRATRNKRSLPRANSSQRGLRADRGGIRERA
jgi:hypothetical protein